MSRRFILSAALSLLCSAGVSAAPDFKATPEEVASSFVAAYQQAPTLQAALLSLFRISESQVEGEEILQFIERNQKQYSSSLIQCASNLKNLGTGLEMYSVDNDGKYPSSLSVLNPDILRQLPVCPSAGRDTYSESYKNLGDGYALHCSGSHHAKVGAKVDQPSYNSTSGLSGMPTLDAASTRTVDVKKVQTAAGGREAVIVLTETLKADLDKPPVTGDCYLHLYKTDNGWWMDQATLPGEVLRNVELLGVLSLAEAAKLKTYSGLDDSLTEGEGNLVDLTPLQHIVLLSQIESAAVPRAAEGLDLDQGLQVRVDDLSYLGRRIASYREETGAWPTTMQAVLGTDAAKTAGPIEFVVSSDGQSLVTNLPGTGYPRLDIPKDYPKVRVQQNGAVTVLYRP